MLWRRVNSDLETSILYSRRESISAGSGKRLRSPSHLFCAGGWATFSHHPIWDPTRYDILRTYPAFHPVDDRSAFILFFPFFLLHSPLPNLVSLPPLFPVHPSHYRLLASRLSPPGPFHVRRSAETKLVRTSARIATTHHLTPLLFLSFPSSFFAPTR